MQNITIAGVIGKNAEIRTTGGGDNVANFPVACDNGKDKSGQKRDATWYEVSCWGKRGDALAPYLLKGGRVCVTGRPTVRVYEGKAYLGVSVNEISLLGGGRQDGNSNQSRDSGSHDAPDDTNVPF